MPELAINKHRGSIFSQDDVGLAGYIGRMNLALYSLFSQHRLECNFGRGVI
jgi:hypothetical protein